MKKLQTKRTSKARVHDSVQLIDLSLASPDSLSDSVRNALSQVSPAERSVVYGSLLAMLKRSHVNIGPLLLLLGIPAKILDELTAPEVAKVIRYVRINDPKAMNDLLPVLGDLLAQYAEPQKVKVSRQAA